MTEDNTCKKNGDSVQLKEQTFISKLKMFL